MEPFYQEIDFILESDNICIDCGERKWLYYSDDHISIKCLGCFEPSRNSYLDIGGYIGSRQEPLNAPPDSMEICIPFNRPNFGKSHEHKYYRSKKEYSKEAPVFNLYFCQSLNKYSILNIKIDYLRLLGSDNLGLLGSDNLRLLGSDLTFKQAKILLEECKKKHCYDLKEGF